MHTPSRARMRLSDFARWIGVSDRYLREMRAQGSVVGVSEGRSYWVDVDRTLANLGRDRPDDPMPGEVNTVAETSTPHVIVLPNGKREPVSVPAASAVEVARQLRPGGRLTGMTKGQFSLLDLMRALLDVTGPADVLISTWSSGIRDAEIAGWLLDSGAMTSLQWVVDRSFATRQPEYASRMMERFGPGAIATAEVHAKICLIAAGDWRIAVRSSMNLNRNPRFEQFDIDDDPAVWAHYDAHLRDIVRLAGSGFGDKATAMRVLQQSMGGDLAPPDVYAHTETDTKRDAQMAARSTDRRAEDGAPAGDGEVSYHSERALHEKARRELAEQRLQERRGQLLDAARTRNAIGSAMVAVRERIMAIETRAHGQMGAEEHAWLAVELRTALAEAYGSAERVMVDLMGEPADDDTADGDA